MPWIASPENDFAPMTVPPGLVGRVGKPAEMAAKIGTPVAGATCGVAGQVIGVDGAFDHRHGRS